MTTTRNPGLEDTTDVRAVPRRSVGQTLLSSGTVLALVVLIVFFFAMRPDVFLSFTNVRNILYQVAILAIIAGAQTIVMVVGDFDLSVAATSALAGAVAASLMLGGLADRARRSSSALVVGLLIGSGERRARRLPQSLGVRGDAGDLDVRDGARLPRHRGNDAVQPAGGVQLPGAGPVPRDPAARLHRHRHLGDPVVSAPIHDARSQVVRDRRQRRGVATVGSQRPARSTAGLHGRRAWSRRSAASCWRHDWAARALCRARTTCCSPWPPSSSA